MELGGLVYHKKYVYSSTVPFRVRIHTITLSVHLNYPFRLKALAGDNYLNIKRF